MEIRHVGNYGRVIAIAERSSGNETVGDMWVETMLFDKTTSIDTIIQWAKNCGITGRLTIVIDADSCEETLF